jgi:ABC-type molybdate transport system substrate-binding protein
MKHALFALALAAGAACADDIRVLSGGAAQSPLNAALPAFEVRSGHKVAIAFAPAGEIAKRIAAGVRAPRFSACEKNLNAVSSGASRSVVVRNS